MSEVCSNYIIELLCRIDQKYDALVEKICGLEEEVKSVKESNRVRDEDRRCHEKLVFDMLLKLCTVCNIPFFKDVTKAEFPSNRCNQLFDEGGDEELKKLGSISRNLSSVNLLSPELKNVNNVNLEHSLKDGSCNEESNECKKSKNEETTPTLKSGTIQVETCTYSFVAGESHTTLARGTQVKNMYYSMQIYCFIL